ncbi:MULTISPECIES: inorganic phosphate transporter [Thermodesulfobacterium]|jgi:PiT family inorganic phosphate transporter|uniref:Phosphate permease n=2 Tax=Thermodesulfobacterium commune TaxID=1741 RepID=A0A075WR72_9BACT|nr:MULTISPECIES: inorganic phosphate transporter [Thermodesulfobacterium]KUK37517.1 MAG: Phosphate transporter [Thermodesulfobacterium commune]AIH03356.1 phosphate permease [Thermodesulfobacterium commune DSM 2178]MBZ4681198.1 phosphate permease [Thermodesulfobacterium sp.]MDK2861667.1 inorganic phosphate transporter, PiT family [Thermodesulfobacterium sp.]MDN5379192.1 inorganic phosphate transporter, PiT family [Thermodesulfobacterium sp.]
MIEIAIIASLLIAFGIGSNDASNALGISIGAGIIRFKRAVLLFGVLVFLGVLLNGDKVMKTVGKSLVETTPLSLSLSLLLSALLILFSNWRKLPLSTHQVIIGSLIGSGLALKLSVNVFSLIKIVVSWLVSPIIACLVSFFLYKLVIRVTSRLPFFRIENLLKMFLLISSSLISYNTGANELATVLGPVMYTGLSLNKIFLYFIASTLIFLGAVLLSHRVIETVGKGITSLDPLSGFVAQFGAGLCIFSFTLLGMPISTTYCIIGGITGVGLTKGFKTIKLDLIKKIGINWVFTLTTSVTLAFLLTKLVLNIL